MNPGNCSRPCRTITGDLRNNMQTGICYILIVLLLVLPSLVQAEAGWTDHMRIEELIPTSRHYYEVKLPVKKNPSGCPDNVWFYQDYGTKGSEKMFETLLAGIESGNRVRVYVTCKCNVKGYSEFTSVGIIP